MLETRKPFFRFEFFSLKDLFQVTLSQTLYLWAEKIFEDFKSFFEKKKKVRTRKWLYFFFVSSYAKQDPKANPPGFQSSKVWTDMPVHRDELGGLLASVGNVVIRVQNPSNGEVVRLKLSF